MRITSRCLVIKWLCVLAINLAFGSDAFSDDKTYHLLDYLPPLAAENTWLYSGRDEDGRSATTHLQVISTQQTITSYTGGVSSSPYFVTVACFRYSYDSVNPDGFVTSSSDWIEYRTFFDGFRIWGDDDGEESLRADGGINFGTFLTVGETNNDSTQLFDRGNYIGQVSGSVTLLGIEDITVSAGTFTNCLHLRFTLILHSETQVWDEWWALGIGEVKHQGVSGSGSMWLRELKSYQVAVKPPENLPPVAEANGPYFGEFGVPFTFDGNSSSDPNGSIITYFWDFGDGSSDFGERVDHRYDETGVYTVTLTVTDQGGLVGSDSTTATILLEQPNLLSQTQVSQLYVSIFGRASEGEGNAYWRSEQGNMTTAADTMLNTDAAINYFGANLNTNQAFIEHIYLNTLNKTIANDSAGIAYWVGELNKGKSRGHVVASLIGVIEDYAPGGPYYNPVDAATVAAYNQFTNRVAVSDFMADTVHFNPDGWETVTSFSSGLIVTDDPNTVDTATLMIADMIQDGQYDTDSDGYSENQGDCNDSNNTIYPGAADVCEDSIDQDCDGVDSVCQQLWIGDWIQVNFLGTDENGYAEEWGSDDPTGIGFVANVSKDEWIERDEYGNGCAVVYAYSVNGNRYSMRGKSTTCPYLGNVTDYTDSGRLEFMDNNTMILWYDYPPGAPDEIIAFKWKRK